MEQKNGECNTYKTSKKSDGFFQANVIFPRNTLRAICEASSALVHMGLGQRLIDKHLVLPQFWREVKTTNWIYDSSAFKKLQKKTPAPASHGNLARQHVGILNIPHSQCTF